MINKNKFSLNNLLSNKKIAFIISLILSVAIWGSVAFNSTDETREFREVRVPIILSGANNLVAYTNNEVMVTVTIQGRRWEINKLISEDIEIKADTSRITSPGNHVVPINAPDSISKNYTVFNVSPSEVTVKCDYSGEEVFPVSVNIENVTLSKEAEDNGLTIDTPILNGVDINGVTVKGPATTITAIEKIVATVEQTMEISKNTNSPVRLIAYDEAGREVDTQYCQFINIETGAIIDTNMLSVNLPIVNYVMVPFEMDFTSVPEVFKKRITINPQSVTLKGDAEQVSRVADNIRNLGEFDIRRINLENHSHIIGFFIPEGVTVAEQISSVQIDFDTSGLRTRTFSEIGLTASNIEFKNVPEGFSFDATTQSQLTNLVVVGSTNTINRLRASDIKFEIDLQNASFVGPKSLVPTIKFGSFTDVWAYFGPNSESDYKIVVNGKVN